MTKKASIYRDALLEMISMIRDKAFYLNGMEIDGIMSSDKHEGMKDAYHFVLDGIVTYIKVQPDLELEEFGLTDFDPNEVLYYKPLH